MRVYARRLHSSRTISSCLFAEMAFLKRRFSYFSAVGKRREEEHPFSSAGTQAAGGGGGGKTLPDFTRAATFENSRPSVACFLRPLNTGFCFLKLDGRCGRIRSRTRRKQLSYERLVDQVTTLLEEHPDDLEVARKAMQLQDNINGIYDRWGGIFLKLEGEAWWNKWKRCHSGKKRSVENVRVVFKKRGKR